MHGGLDQVRWEQISDEIHESVGGGHFSWIFGTSILEKVLVISFGIDMYAQTGQLLAVIQAKLSGVWAEGSLQALDAIGTLQIYR